MLNHSKIDEGSTLHVSPPLQRLQRNLRDLITIACESYLGTPSRSLCLTRLEYVSDEKLEGKFCMHLRGLVREADHADAIILNLSFTAEVGR